MAERISDARANARPIDRIDKQLLAALQADGRLRLEDLARRVELAPSSVHDRLRRLQRDGVIRRWTVDVSPEALGLAVLALVGVQASRPCSDLVAPLEQIPEIEELHSVAGQLSFILKLRATNTEHLLQLIEQLKQIPGIENTETTIVLKTHLERGPVVRSA
jgi:Lrp/AsnC family transcriptional regulator, leucine-responsive regulatory protein